MASEGERSQRGEFLFIRTASPAEYLTVTLAGGGSSIIRKYIARLGRLSKLALLVLITGATVTFVAWRLMKNGERAHIHGVTGLAASAVRADLVSDMQSWIQGQIRVARLWEVKQPSPSEWQAYANLYIEHHPGCLGLEWLNARGGDRWLVGARGAEPAPQLRRDGDDVREQVLNDALQSKDARVSGVFTSLEGRSRWLTAVPIYTQGHLRGTVIGLFDVQQSLDTMLDDIRGLNFSVALQQNDTEIYRLSGSTDQYRNDSEQTFDLLFGGASWKLQVWARPETMLEMRSNFSMLVFLFGSFLSLLLTSIVQAHHELASENTERRRAEKALRASQARFAGILEISAAAVISTTGDQRITLFNQAAEKMFGYKAADAIGQPLDILIPEAFREMHRQHFTRFARSDQSSLLMSERSAVLGLRKDGSEFPMAASISKLQLGADATFTVLCNDITAQVRVAEELRSARDELEVRVLQRTAELEKSNQSLQSEIMERKVAEETVRVLSSKLMCVQDEERRHLARELHDGATQNMVSLALNLNTLRLSTPAVNAESRAILEECMRLIEGSTNELRTISYLLHPPLLEELGLVRALRGYIDGFSRRSGIRAVFSVPEDLGRLPRELELTMFRIAQEALSNVHRHSQSPTASIVLARDGENLSLEIADQGIGINHGKNAMGVGLAGMRERVKLLRGELEIKTGPAGTTIRTVLPSMKEKQRCA